MTSKERFVLFMLTALFLMAILMLVIASLQGCAHAKAGESVTIQVMNGPGNERCFVFYNGSTPFGGNCQ